MMQKIGLKQDLVNKLIELNKKNALFTTTDIMNGNWTKLKLEIKQQLAKLKINAKIFEVTAYVLLTVSGVVSFVKVLGLSSLPDLNKGAFLILFTVIDVLVTFYKKRKLNQLEKQCFLFDILEKLEVEKQVLTASFN